MLDIGWTELLVIGVVALIVVGPKDLPAMFRTLGRFTGKMRGMAREFQRAMDEAAKESGVGDVASDLRKATSNKALGLDKLNAAADRFEKWDPMKSVKSPPADADKRGPETRKLAEERAAEAARVKEAAAERADARAAGAAPAPAAEPDAGAAAPEGDAKA